MRRNFTVKVTHQGKSLAGVSIQIDGHSGGNSKSFSALTDARGSARFADVPSGDYWIKAELLGIGAGYECFHIDPFPSRKAKKVRRYTWGDDPSAYRQASGQFVDSQPGKEGNPLQRLLHRVNVPVSGARLELHRPGIESVVSTVTDADGHFAFDRVPNGIYVLHIASGVAPGNRAYDSADLLVEFSDKANRSILLIKYREASAGSCGGTGLELN